MPLDLDAFQKTQVYQARATVTEVLEDLRTVEGLPGRDAKRMRQLVFVGLGLIFGAVLCFMVFGFLDHLREEPLKRTPPWLTVLLLGMVFGGFGTLIASQVVGQGALRPPLSPHAEQRRQLLTRLLRRLQVDLTKDAPVDVKLDLTLTTVEGKRVHQGKQGTWTRVDFIDPWLSLQGAFADSTHLHLSVVDHARTLYRARTNERGKVKTKRKQSGFSLMTVALRVKAERHPGLAAMEEQAKGAVRLPPGATLKRLRVAGDRAELRVLLDEDWMAPAEKTDVSRTATMMLLSLYQVLNHSSSRGRPGNVRSTS